MGEWHLLKGSWLVPSCCEQFTEDRCFRAGGFIIRAKATIHTNGFIVRAGFGSAAAGQPRFDTRFYIGPHHPYQNAVSE